MTEIEKNKVIVELLILCLRRRKEQFKANGYKRFVYREAIARLIIDIRNSKEFTIEWFIGHIDKMKFGSTDVDKYYINVHRIARKIAMRFKDDILSVLLYSQLHFTSK
jgi:hypothetical protein